VLELWTKREAHCLAQEQSRFVPGESELVGVDLSYGLRGPPAGERQIWRLSARDDDSHLDRQSFDEERDPRVDIGIGDAVIVVEH
jgi:hypothetical protein